jgi:hypothetical protein
MLQIAIDGKIASRGIRSSDFQTTENGRIDDAAI